MIKQNFIFYFFILTLFFFKTSASDDKSDFTLNKMHPQIQALDIKGHATIKNPDVEKTCTACHDTGYINRHNSHFKGMLKVSCDSCHLQKSLKEGVTNWLDKDLWLKKEYSLFITKPSSQSCLSCHGEKTNDMEPLILTDSLESSLYWHSHLQKSQGSIYSAQKISQSHINLANKDQSSRAWDVHAQRQMSCVSCHSNQNSPSQLSFAKNNVEHLKVDPRKELPLHQYLSQPNHQIVTASCINCHDSQVSHKDFPYKKRHLDAVACQSCHIPEVQGPLLKEVNQWIVNTDGRPQFTYWNTKYDPQSPLPEENQFNTALINPFEPFLLSVNNILAPYNIILNKTWVSDTPAPETVITPDELVKVIWKNESYRKIMIASLDKNKNGNLEKDEWSKDIDKQQLAEIQIANWLSSAGYVNPRPIIRYDLIPINHGVTNARMALRQCSSCHGQDSRLMIQNSQNSDWFNNQVKPLIKQEAQWPAMEKYVIGTTRINWIDSTGYILFILLVVILFTHAFFRWKFRRFRDSSHEKNTDHKTEKIRIYGRFERFWHWTLALSTGVLLLTGLEIHYYGPNSLLGLNITTPLHNAAAFLFFANSALSLIYYVATKKITQFLPNRYQLLMNIASQLRYYGYGIFVGEPHPVKTLENKLNPLQQITYLVLLNFLLPLQVVTGVLMWAIDKSDVVSGYLKGYSVVGPIHTAGSWLFLSFLILHIYLTTTGTTLLANIKGMLTGEEEILVPNKKEDSNHEEVSK